MSPIAWGWGIHQLHVHHHPNEYPRNDIKLSDGEVLALENAEYPFIAIAPSSTQTLGASTWYGRLNGFE